MKVGCKFLDKKTGKRRVFSYKDVVYDEDKWADASRFQPADYDLVYLKVENHKKTVPGWSVGKQWDGLNYKNEYKVLYWRKHEQI